MLLILANKGITFMSDGMSDQTVKTSVIESNYSVYCRTHEAIYTKKSDRMKNSVKTLHAATWILYCNRLIT